MQRNLYNPHMQCSYRKPRIIHARAAAIIVLLLLGALPTYAAQWYSSAATRVYLPIATAIGPASPFGFDLRSNLNDAIMPYVRSAQPRWVRAGDVLWSEIEPVRGGGYRWAAMAEVEANIARLRAAGIEPTLVIQRSPSWAQRVSGRLCSPPRPEAIADFVRFARALAARYAGQVNYWEIWNEPDIAPALVKDEQGMGCWIDPSQPDLGGAYYGTVVRQVAPAMRAANPHAQILAGALLYQWPDDAGVQTFLKGMLSTGAGNTIDALSFHAYGEWGAGDLLLAKTNRIRQILSAYGLSNKPLFATEIAATCGSNIQSQCQPDYTRWKTRQANYAARIYAETIALKLKGAFWYTLALDNPGFQYSQLVDVSNTSFAPRQSYYAFTNSARLLQGAQYVGPPLTEPPLSQTGKVQVLPFQKSQSRLYVLWVPRTDFPVIYNLPVPAGARAICTDHLDKNPAATYDCSDTNRDGMIPRAVNELPQYVELFP